MPKKRESIKRDVQEAVGGEDELAGKQAVREMFGEQEKRDADGRQEVLDILKKKKQFTFDSYNFHLATILYGQLKLLEFPGGWKWDVSPTKSGIVLTLWYKSHVFQAAFAPTREERYDLNAVEMYVVRTENTIDRVMETEQPNGHPETN